MNLFIVREGRGRLAAQGALFAAGLAVCCLFCIWQIRRGYLVLGLMVGLPGAALFGVGVALCLARFRRPNVILTVSKEGILDSSAFISSGFVPWENVAAYGITEIYGQRLLSIELVNCEAFFAGMPAWKARAYRMNRAMGLPTISYNLQAADQTVEAVLAAIEGMKEPI